MRYYVYENWTHKKAIVHRADCAYCNNGDGLHSLAGGWNDRWHGPFASSEAAMIAARSLRRLVTRACTKCGASNLN